MHEKESGAVDLLTKGDNNAVDDRGLYAASQALSLSHSRIPILSQMSHFPFFLYLTDISFSVSSHMSHSQSSYVSPAFFFFGSLGSIENT